VVNSKLLSVLLLLGSVATSPMLAEARGAGGAHNSVGGYYYPQSIPTTPPRTQGMRPQRPVFGPGVPRTAPQARPAPGGAVARPHRPVSGPILDLKGRDFRHLPPAERALWTRGRWHHGCYRRICGWWWFTGGFWYWYLEPEFPYPDEISDYDYEDSDDESAPPEATPPRDRTGDVYYYCGDPSGYYPDVPTCNLPWQAVPATPSK